MAAPVTVVASGGIPVCESANGFGLPLTPAVNGFGTAVTIVANGGGIPVIFISVDGVLWPGGVAPGGGGSHPTFYILGF